MQMIQPSMYIISAENIVFYESNLKSGTNLATGMKQILFHLLSHEYKDKKSKSLRYERLVHWFD